MSGFLMVSWWRHRLQSIMQSLLSLLKLHKLTVGKPDLSRGGLTLCHSVLDHGLNLHQNIPLIREIHIHDHVAGNCPNVLSKNVCVCCH